MGCCCSGPPKVPTFNLFCNLWTAPAFPPPAGPPRLANVPCQLAFPQLSAFLSVGVAMAIYLKTPKLTDIRGFISLTGGDTVEVPAGSGRYYICQMTDDVGKGFTNEYRISVLLQSMPWPTPAP